VMADKLRPDDLVYDKRVAAFILRQPSDEHSVT
jgi:hypothetical protein